MNGEEMERVIKEAYEVFYRKVVETAAQEAGYDWTREDGSIVQNAVQGVLSDPTMPFQGGFIAGMRYMNLISGARNG